MIEPSQSGYISSFILVPIKSVDGQNKWRMCVDYKKLNRKLIPDSFPLRIEDIFDNLGRTKYFPVMDLQAISLITWGITKSLCTKTYENSKCEHRQSFREKLIEEKIVIFIEVKLIDLNI